jgi:hypothetical protein
MPIGDVVAVLVTRGSLATKKSAQGTAPLRVSATQALASAVVTGIMRDLIAAYTLDMDTRIL